MGEKLHQSPGLFCYSGNKRNADRFILEAEIVYQIRRLRLLDDQPVMIETGYIPIKIVPELSRTIVSKSIFNYLEDKKNQTVTKSFLSIEAQPSTSDDQELLHLTPQEPVGVMSGIFFLDDGTPFELSNMRLHYKYMKYNAVVELK